jgi:DNA repair protein RadA/Sms
VCLALVSAEREEPVALDVAVLGEVALSGDVRPVPMLAERVAEAARLGFRRLLVPPGTAGRVKSRTGGSELVEVGSLKEALVALRRAATAVVR